MTGAFHQNVGLSANELSQVFPFHIAFRPDGTILQLGQALARLCPALNVGSDIGAHLRLLRPHGGLDYRFLHAAAPEFVVVELTGAPVPLRGQTLALADGLVLLVSPWITDAAQLGPNLRLCDFALHDPALDYVTLLETKNAALLDASRIAERLHLTNTDLSAALTEREVGHARLSALISLLPSAIMVVDEQNRVVLANQRATNLFGLDIAVKATLGTDLCAWAEASRAHFVHPEQFLRGICSPAAKTELSTGEALELLDGRVLERDYVPISDAAGLRGQLWQYRDVSEKRRVERELSSARARAEDANAAKSAFLAMISHEMRTPLGVIVGLAELLSQPRSQAEHDEFLQRLQANAQSLATIIEDVLDFSRLESGRMSFQDVRFDPAAIVTEVAKALAPNAQGNGVELVADIDESVPLSVRGDPARLRQLLVNLVGNAVKFTDQGEIVVSVCCLSRASGSAVLRYSVQDTGCGIPAELHAQIFERFVRADQSSARTHGTGLGLSISALLARGMGGQISLESEPQVGSRFHFDLDHRVDVMEARPHPPLRGLRIAVIDPLASARRAIAHLSRRLGAEVIEASSTDEVSELRAKFDIIICDDERSAEDVERIRRRAFAGQADPPRCVVVRSAFTRASVASHDLAMAVKPMSQEDLLRAITSLRTANSGVPKLARATGVHRLAQTARILIVDDDQDNRVVLKNLVQQSEHALVEVASDGISALKMLDSGLYDLVLTDLQMPGIDGFELTRRIRGGSAALTRANIPIIAVSAHALPEFVRLAEEAGMNDFISKPIDVTRLRDILDRWLDPRPRVLIVDDCEDALMVTRKQLDAIGSVTAFAVDNGLAALERVARGDIDIILLDMAMPGMDGCAVVRAIRERTDLKQPQVVALTGQHSAAQVQRFMDAGCDFHLVKPARLAMLSELLVKLNVQVSRPSMSSKAASPMKSTSAIQLNADVLDMIPGYIANRRADVIRLRQILRSQVPLSEAGQLGHRMKGTGGAYGFPRITELGAAMEAACQRDERTGVDALVDQLEKHLDEIDQALLVSSSSVCG